MRQIAFLLLLLISSTVYGQRPIESSADIYQEIKKLKVLSNVLYIAAHPDDENTRLIAWLENEALTRTAYLSLTRGDGGQNLIGSEKGDAMGLLRTQELLEARKIDGAEQFFSRAIDFGYSKTAEETFSKWDKEGVLADVVYTIRKFQPDVIITRFPPDSRAGHGHHTASAILAEMAFELAADESAFPEQLEKVQVWQAKRILWNTSVWWDKQLPEKAADEKDYIKIDIGTYNPVLGLSYSEIAADSRSQHKSQGFGSSRSRGSQIEYLKHSKGKKAKSDLFEGIDQSWSRIKNGKNIEELIDEILNDYNLGKPESSIDQLIELYKRIEKLEKSIYTEEKLESIKNIIKAAAGIHVQFNSDKYIIASNEAQNIEGRAIFINRSNIPIQLIAVSPDLDSSFKNINLKNNIPFSSSFKVNINPSISNPYWLTELEEAKQAAEKKINYDPLKRRMNLHGLPENEPLLEFKYTIVINEQEFTFKEKADYQWTDRVDGELHRDIIASPNITVNPSKNVYLFTNSNSQEIELIVESHTENVLETIKLIAPENWTVEPNYHAVKFEKAGEQKSFTFTVSPPSSSSEAILKFYTQQGPARQIQHINYPHIKPQVLYPLCQVKAVKMDIKNTAKTVAYIQGSGDDVDQYLEQLGLNVTSIKANDLALIDLNKFDCIILGIRAYNTEEELISGNIFLNKYVEDGGNLIIQYNTNRGLKTEQLGPLPFKISRNRVTDEFADVKFLDHNHPVLNKPNKIDRSDFDFWVQERGLYFASEWDENFTPILSWNDAGEEAQTGGLIIGKYGKGHVIYTGISFFRQFPAGVAGSYRLMSNLISYGK